MFNCLSEGEDQYLTPNIDRLASEGTIMRNQFVVAPVCTPSRYNCLTGRFASRAINSSFIEKTSHEEGQTVIQWNTFITKGEKALPHYLQEAGYKTGMVGKNHVVEVQGYQQFPDYWGDPRTLENKALLKSNYDKTRQAILNCGFDYAESVYFDNPGFIGLGHLAVQNMDWVAKGGLDFIDKYHNDPFFLYFATTIPHGPTEPDRSWKADPTNTALVFLDAAPDVLPARETLTPRIKEAGIKGHNKELILWLDDAVGAVIDRLEKHGILDNTIIFFFNDHGQRAKGHLYQGGVHNPSIIWSARGFQCGNVSEAKIQNIDFAPTILDFAGVAYADDSFDGISFKSVLDGEVAESRESLFFELGYARGVVIGDYKFMSIRYPEYATNMTPEERAEILVNYNEPRIHKKMKTVNDDPSAPFSHFSVMPGGEVAEHESYGKLPGYFDPDQMYNLKTDPRELNNLANNPEYAAKFSEMRAKLQEYLNDLPGTFGDLKEE
jgi:arylsulfatase A-like enzyme